jgi:hypothetical protein
VEFESQQEQRFLSSPERQNGSMACLSCYSMDPGFLPESTKAGQLRPSSAEE